MKPANCPKINECDKIKMVLDKDMLDFQYAEAIMKVCAGCSEIHRQQKVKNLVTPVLEGGQDGT